MMKNRPIKFTGYTSTYHDGNLTGTHFKMIIYAYVGIRLTGFRPVL